MNYYIYYRLDPTQLGRARASVDLMFEALEKEFGVRGAWLRRRDDPSTFMEVYAGVQDPERFELVLEEESARRGIAGCIASGSSRRIEVFQPAR